MTGKKRSHVEATNRSVTYNVAVLPLWEMWMYVGGWTIGVAYAVYSVYKASYEYVEDLNDYFLVSGWKILTPKKDSSNFEWDFWSSWFLELWPWLVGHMGLSLLCRITSLNKYVLQLVYSQVLLYTVLSLSALLLIWGHVIIMYLVTFTRSKVIVWLTSFALLTTLNVDRTIDIMKLLVDNDPFERKFYLILFLIAMTNLRYTSAALELTQTRVEGQKSVMESAHGGSACRESARGASARVPVEIPLNTSTYMIAHYVFYLPLMFTGPVMTYDEFSKQVQIHHNASSTTSIIVFIKKSLRIVFWIAMIEYSLHYLYFNCIHLDVSLMKRLPLWAVAGVGYCHGQFFMVKYVVFYGVASLQTSIDGIQTPHQPKCISRITFFSHMWRYFDRGFYSFIKRYIYVPLGGSRLGIPRQILASIICFIFIFLWHGAEEYLAIWCILNLLGIMVETLGGWIVVHPYIIQKEELYMTSANRRRLHALLTVPLFTMSAIGIFYFFGGREVGNCYFKRLIIDGFPQSTILIVIFLYCCVQVSIETFAWEARKQHLE